MRIASSLSRPVRVVALAGAILAACSSGGSSTSSTSSGQSGGHSSASTSRGASTSSSTGCPETPIACIAGYTFNEATCSCMAIPCSSNEDCTGAETVCSDGMCTSSQMVAACAAIFTCQNAIAGGGTCDCHADCQCDPGNASGKGATYCLGAGGTCIPRCTTQSDPAMFCACILSGTQCAPSGACELPCKSPSDCQQGTCTDGLCVVPLDPSINTGPCADAGPTDASAG